MEKPGKKWNSLEAALVQAFQSLGRAVCVLTLDMRFSACAIALVLCHSFILGYTDFSLQRASSIFICQSTPRWVSLTSSDQARIRC